MTVSARLILTSAVIRGLVDAAFHLQVMKVDAEESRKEEGCTRFDVLQDRDKPNVFHFYEVYVSAEAAALHKTLPHYKVTSLILATLPLTFDSVIHVDPLTSQLWADFKASVPGISETQTVEKLYHII